ncbi:hypothetical protein ACIBG8_02265 [Nonomuraea sp. NPDC050556]|uniref:hypothetical protein n=1 Tax=Nonomuraea sp. NPDC050556 TaxID=3364369 RepID=UPI0037B10FB5
MADAQRLFDDLAEEHLVKPEVSMGRILANEGLTVNGKLYAFCSRDRLIVKVPLERARALLSDGTAEPVEMGKRRMKEWVAFTSPQEEEWRAFMAEALAFVESLTKR